MPQSLAKTAQPLIFRRSLRWMAALLFSNAVAALANTPIEYYEGTAFDPAGHEIYSELHWIREDEGDMERLILFTCPDGKAFARKFVRSAGRSLSPLFELEDGRHGYREGVRIAENGAREVFVRRDETQSEQTALLDSLPGLVVDAGFDEFVSLHWDELLAGSKQSVEFLLPSRLRSYTFVLEPSGTERLRGVPAQRFRLKLDAWFGFALPSIDMAYASDSRTILEYAGISNIRDNKGKNLKVRIEFDPLQRTPRGDPDALSKARNALLDGQCGL